MKERQGTSMIVVDSNVLAALYLPCGNYLAAAEVLLEHDPQVGCAGSVK